MTSSSLELHHFSQTPLKPVSPNNPCPVLRSLVAHDLINNEKEDIGYLSELIVRVADAGDGHPTIQGGALTIASIANIANGISPVKILRGLFVGETVYLDKLRFGPLYKDGVSSSILDNKGQFDEAEFKRLETFASEKTAQDGTKELGMNIKEVTKFMDANFERRSNAKPIQRRMMDGELPVALRVFGKDDANGKRYISTADLRGLFEKSQLPQRVVDRLAHHH